MNIFKSYTYNWKEIGVFKVGLIALGMILGAYFSDFVMEYIAIFFVVAVVASIYIVVISQKQIKKKGSK